VTSRVATTESLATGGLHHSVTPSASDPPETESARPAQPARLKIRSVALINPLGDYGISQYTYELAEGLSRQGVRVTVYAHSGSLKEHLYLPRQHRYLPVLGGLLLRQKSALNAELDPQEPKASATSALALRLATLAPARSRAALRNWVLMIELAWHLRRFRYDVVWTQWPSMGPGTGLFWRLCKLFGLRTAHTVHNVLPHEESPGDKALCSTVYRSSDTLFVHSKAALEEMQEVFPHARGKTFVTHHGLYTLYPRRPQAREPARTRLGIRGDQVAVLFAGGPRPYKNVDAVLAAFAAQCDQRAVLVVVGQESGYADLVPEDPLGRTRRLAQQFGILDRLILIPRHLHIAEVVDLFEAVDALILPYSQSDGSGQLLLGMTYGKFIIASRAGGMEEYLHHYPRCEILQDFEPRSVSQAIGRAVRRIAAAEDPLPLPLPDLQWSNVARAALDLLQRQS
jgi:glycosyltransferase involved in cell wall biosynthesis